MVASEDAMSEAITKGLGGKKNTGCGLVVQQDCAVRFTMRRKSAIVF